MSLKMAKNDKSVIYDGPPPTDWVGDEGWVVGHPHYGLMNGPPSTHLELRFDGGWWAIQTMDS
jgi:hypothetical protein